MAFVTVAKLEQLPDGVLMKTRIGEQGLLIYRRGTEISAVSARCTHLNMSLPNQQENGVVTCAFHGAEFELRNGHCRYFPNLPKLSDSIRSHDLQSFPVRILENRVQVDCG